MDKEADPKHAAQQAKSTGSTAESGTKKSDTPAKKDGETTVSSSGGNLRDKDVEGFHKVDEERIAK